MHMFYTVCNIPIIRRSDKFSFNYQISLGGAYLPRIFDIAENHLNRAVSSQLNIYFRLGIDGKIKLFPAVNWFWKQVPRIFPMVKQDHQTMVSMPVLFPWD